MNYEDQSHNQIIGRLRSQDAFIAKLSLEDDSYKSGTMADDHYNRGRQDQSAESQKTIDHLAKALLTANKELAKLKSAQRRKDRQERNAGKQVATNASPSIHSVATVLL